MEFYNRMIEWYYKIIRLNGCKRSGINKIGVIHLVRTQEGGGGSIKCVRMRTRGEGGLTHEVRTQSKKLVAFCIHPATIN